MPVENRNAATDGLGDGASKGDRTGKSDRRDNTNNRSSAQPVEVTRFKKSNGPLTKKIRLVDGKPVSDGSHCKMSKGSMQRCILTDLHAFARMIE
jgi:hypothetical protein